MRVTLPARPSCAGWRKKNSRRNRRGCEKNWKPRATANFVPTILNPTTRCLPRPMKLPVEESEFIPCDLLDIVPRIRLHNPAAATRFLEAFKSTIDLLSRMPHLGRLRTDLGAPETRSWQVSGF